MNVARWRCDVCHAVTPEPELLTAPSPFDASDTITACPGCRQWDSLALVCDEPGCQAVAHCGWPSDEGYRRTCSAHYRS